MHVIYFKSKYAYFEEATKYDDGVIFEVHFFYIQADDNPSLSPLIEKLPQVQRWGTSVAVDEYPLSRYFTPFTSDYFIYCGKIIAEEGGYKVMWIISRHLIGISNRQMCEFRKLHDQEDLPLLRNSHHIHKIGNRKIYHVNPSNYIRKILFPFPKTANKTERLCIRLFYKPFHKTVKSNASGQKLKKNQEKILNKKSEMICKYGYTGQLHNEGNSLEKNLPDRKKSIFSTVVKWVRNSKPNNKKESDYSHAGLSKDGAHSFFNLKSIPLTEISETKTSDISLTWSEEIKNFAPSIAEMKNKDVQTGSDLFMEYKEKFLISNNLHRNGKKKSLVNYWHEKNKYNSNTNIKNALHTRYKNNNLSELGSNFSLQILQVEGKEDSKDSKKHQMDNKKLFSLSSFRNSLSSNKSKRIREDKFEGVVSNRNKRINWDNDCLYSAEFIETSSMTNIKKMHSKIERSVEVKPKNSIKTNNINSLQEKGGEIMTQKTMVDNIQEFTKYYENENMRKNNHCKQNKSVGLKKNTGDETQSTLNTRKKTISQNENCRTFSDSLKRKSQIKLESDYFKPTNKVRNISSFKTESSLLPTNVKDHETNSNKKLNRNWKVRRKHNHQRRSKEVVTRKKSHILSSSSLSKCVMKNYKHYGEQTRKQRAIATAEGKTTFGNLNKTYDRTKIKQKPTKLVSSLKVKGGIKEETTSYGNLKVKNTSHESLYIFIKEAKDKTEANSEKQKKSGIIADFFVSTTNNCQLS